MSGMEAGQSHSRLQEDSALKGHGFSRAETWREKQTGFSH
jgi:hypothetical protein